MLVVLVVPGRQVAAAAAAARSSSSGAASDCWAGSSPRSPAMPSFILENQQAIYSSIFAL